MSTQIKPLNETFNTTVAGDLKWTYITALGVPSGMTKEEKEAEDTTYKYTCTLRFPINSELHVAIHKQLTEFWERYKTYTQLELGDMRCSSLKEETVKSDDPNAIDPATGKPLRLSTGFMLFTADTNTTYNNKTLKGVPVDDQGLPCNDKVRKVALYVPVPKKNEAGVVELDEAGNPKAELKEIIDSYKNPNFPWYIGEGSTGFILGNLSGNNAGNGIHKIKVYLEGVQISSLTPVTKEVTVTAPVQNVTLTPVQVEIPAPVDMPTEPAPVDMPTEPAPVDMPTEPAPVAQPTQPAPVAQPTQPAPVAQPTQPAPVAPTYVPPTA